MNEKPSLLGWAISALGPTYIVLLPLSALLSFVVVLVLLFRGRGPMTAASILLFVHAPLMIGIFAAIHGLISSYQVIALGGATPKPAEVAEGFSTALFAPLVALFLMAPTYLAAAVGTFAKSVFGRHDNRSSPTQDGG